MWWMFKWILRLLVLAVLVLAALLVYRLKETRQLIGVVHDVETHTPLEGARISIAGYTTSTNARGEYSITIPRGMFVLTANADGYASIQTRVNGEDLFTGTIAVNLALTQNRVAGVVQDAETNQPMANVLVQIGEKTVTTNAQGVFQARGVKNGSAVTAQVLGYQPSALVFSGQTDFGLALVPNTVNTSVIDQFTRQPIANAQIQAGEAAVVADTQGHAVLRRVKPGVSIRATAPGYEAASASFNGDDVQLVLRPNTLDGTVVDATTGQPIRNTLVYLGTSVVATNAQGAYHLENMPAKAFIILKAPGYRKTQIDVSGTVRRDVKLSPFTVKGIRIPFGTTPDHVHEEIDLVNKTELNSIVIDVKSERGRIAWDTQVPLAKQIDAAYLRGVDPREVVELCRQHNIYCIARFSVFRDTQLATARPNLALRYPSGTVFIEGGERAWTNPLNTDVWDYNLALAKEVAALGFDEIQFDYIRFPGRNEGLYSGAASTEEGRVAAITGFLARAQKELHPTGIFISADVFGLTTATNDDQYTGQRLRDLGPYLDYISPMVYPDVWAEASFLLSNGLGIPNCTEAVRCPYEVIYNSYKRAAEKTPTKIRLWLQAYPGRGDFGVAQYRLQKNAANDAGSLGWMFWNGFGNYDPKMFGPPEQ